jgi:hypothetical protein
MGTEARRGTSDEFTMRIESERADAETHDGSASRRRGEE